MFNHSLSFHDKYQLIGHEGAVLDLKIDIYKVNQYVITFKGKHNNIEYNGELIYDFDTNNKELHIHDMHAQPNGKGLGNLLISIAAQTAQLNQCTKIRTLYTAPTAMGFYTKMGFIPDPTQEKTSIAYTDETTNERKTVNTTLEWIAKPEDCLAKYQQKPLWKVNLAIKQHAQQPEAASPKSYWQYFTSFFSTKVAPEEQKKQQPPSPNKQPPIA